jgi:hypothetical protein
MAFEKDPDEFGALWVKDGAKGEYMTGEIAGQKVVCFRNTKGGDKAPAWRVLKSKPRDLSPRPVRSDDVPF